MYFFKEYLQEKASQCRETSKCFKEILRGGKVVTTLEIFWMNNKAIIEFSFRMTDVKNYVEFGGCRRRWILALYDSFHHA